MALGGVGYYAAGYFNTNYWNTNYWAELGSAFPFSYSYHRSSKWRRSSAN